MRKKYTRNSDLTHYKTNQLTTNCGSYALRLNEWYHLNLRFEDIVQEWTDVWVKEKNEEGYSDLEISCLYGEILVDCMLEDFKGELEICDGELPKEDNVELIAFNTFCFCEELDYPDVDFHFKVYRDGVWKEKCGSGAVRECDGYHWGSYIGEPIYLYHKIK